MGSESQLWQGPDQASGLAEAVYFDSGDHRLFGWLHHPSGDSAATLGVVICEPFGYEAICSHRGIRGFAESVAVAGLPTLRFDYTTSAQAVCMCPSLDVGHIAVRAIAEPGLDAPTMKYSCLRHWKTFAPLSSSSAPVAAFAIVRSAGSVQARIMLYEPQPPVWS
jgi:hypothetical protein